MNATDFADEGFATSSSETSAVSPQPLHPDLLGAVSGAGDGDGLFSTECRLVVAAALAIGADADDDADDPDALLAAEGAAVGGDAHDDAAPPPLFLLPDIDAMGAPGLGVLGGFTESLHDVFESTLNRTPERFAVSALPLPLLLPLLL